MFRTYGIILVFIGLTASGIVGQESLQDTSMGSLESLLDTKISTAAKYAQTVSEAPASVTIITADDILAFGYQTLEDVMMNIRGFYTSNDRNYAYVGARGFGRPTDYNNRILLLVNGHTINDNVYGSAPIGTEMALDLSTIERIEIVRGPGSALYGTGAMFAVVNIITKRGQSIDGLIATAKTGNYGKIIGLLTYGKEFRNGLDLMISALDGDIKGQNFYYQEYDDPSTNNGRAIDLDQDKYYGLNTTISYRAFSLKAFGISREKEVPTGAWDVIFNAGPSKTLDQWNYIELKYDNPFGFNKNILIRSYFNHYYYKGWLPYDPAQNDASTGEQLGSELQFRWDLTSNNTFTIGTEYQNNYKVTYKYWSGDTVFFYKDKPMDAVSFYTQDEFQVTENLSLTLGVRRDGYSQGNNSTAPRGALVYRPIKSATMKFLYGEAYRKANLYEAYYEDDYSGYKANPSLKPEKISTGEFVWEQRLNKNLIGIVSLYHYKMTNLIDQVIDPEDSLIQYNNINRVKATGVELECDARLQSGVVGFVNYVYQQAKDSNTNTKLTNSPNHLLKIGISLPIQRNFYIGSNFAYESERLTVKDTKTNSFFLTNLNFRYSPRFAEYTEFEKLANKAEFSLQVRNLFNKAYSMPAGFEHQQPSIMQDGRNYYLSIKFRL
jgi:outer membrane receptor for ferrienterochelin and colicins